MAWSEIADAIRPEFNTPITAVAGYLHPAALLLVRAVLASRTDTDRLIDQIEQLNAKIDSIRRGPFYTGLEFLKEAAYDHRTNEERQIALAKAREKFMDAYGIHVPDLPWRALCEFHISLCWLAQGSEKDYLLWHDRTTETIDKFVEAYDSDYSDWPPEYCPGAPKVVKAATIGLFIIPTVGLLTHKAYVTSDMKKHIPLVNQVGLLDLAVRNVESARNGEKLDSYHFTGRVVSTSWDDEPEFAID